MRIQPKNAFQKNKTVYPVEIIANDDYSVIYTDTALVQAVLPFISAKQPISYEHLCDEELDVQSIISSVINSTNCLLNGPGVLVNQLLSTKRTAEALTMLMEIMTPTFQSTRSRVRFTGDISLIEPLLNQPGFRVHYKQLFVGFLPFTFDSILSNARDTHGFYNLYLDDDNYSISNDTGRVTISAYEDLNVIRLVTINVQSDVDIKQRLNDMYGDVADVSLINLGGGIYYIRGLFTDTPIKGMSVALFDPSTYTYQVRTISGVPLISEIDPDKLYPHTVQDSDFQKMFGPQIQAIKTAIKENPNNGELFIQYIVADAFNEGQYVYDLCYSIEDIKNAMSKFYAAFGHNSPTLVNMLYEQFITYAMNKARVYTTSTGNLDGMYDSAIDVDDIVPVSILPHSLAIKGLSYRCYDSKIVDVLVEGGFENSSKLQVLIEERKKTPLEMANFEKCHVISLTDEVFPEDEIAQFNSQIDGKNETIRSLTISREAMQRELVSINRPLVISKINDQTINLINHDKRINATYAKLQVALSKVANAYRQQKTLLEEIVINETVFSHFAKEGENFATIILRTFHRMKAGKKEFSSFIEQFVSAGLCTYQNGVLTSDFNIKYTASIAEYLKIHNLSIDTEFDGKAILSTSESDKMFKSMSVFYTTQFQKTAQLLKICYIKQIYAENAKNKHFSGVNTAAATDYCNRYGIALATQLINFVNQEGIGDAILPGRSHEIVSEKRNSYDKILVSSIYATSPASIKVTSFCDAMSSSWFKAQSEIEEANADVYTKEINRLICDKALEINTLNLLLLERDEYESIIDDLNRVDRELVINKGQLQSLLLDGVALASNTTITRADRPFELFTADHEPIAIQSLSNEQSHAFYLSYEKLLQKARELYKRDTLAHITPTVTATFDPLMYKDWIRLNNLLKTYTPTPWLVDHVSYMTQGSSQDLNMLNSAATIVAPDVSGRIFLFSDLENYSGTIESMPFELIKDGAISLVHAIHVPEGFVVAWSHDDSEIYFVKRSEIGAGGFQAYYCGRSLNTLMANTKEVESELRVRFSDKPTHLEVIDFLCSATSQSRPDMNFTVMEHDNPWLDPFVEILRTGLILDFPRSDKSPGDNPPINFGITVVRTSVNAAGHPRYHEVGFRFCNTFSWNVDDLIHITNTSTDMNFVMPFPIIEHSPDITITEPLSHPEKQLLYYLNHADENQGICRYLTQQCVTKQNALEAQFEWSLMEGIQTVVIEGLTWTLDVNSKTITVIKATLPDYEPNLLYKFGNIIVDFSRLIAIIYSFYSIDYAFALSDTLRTKMINISDSLVARNHYSESIGFDDLNFVLSYTIADDVSVRSKYAMFFLNTLYRVILEMTSRADIGFVTTKTFADSVQMRIVDKKRLIELSSSDMFAINLLMEADYDRF